MAEFNPERFDLVLPGFGDVEKQKKIVSEWSAKYRGLLGALGSLGTEVKVDRVLEHDQDIPPYRFVRNATHEFIFPPQPGSVVLEDDSRSIDSTPGYSLTRESRALGYDKARVEGHLVLFYDDAGSRIEFRATSEGPATDFPRGVLEALDSVFVQQVEA